MYNMVKVFRYGDKIAVRNPANPSEVTHMVKVTFMEEGREGGNAQVSNTTAILDRLLAEELNGETTGLNQFRIHTQPVREDQVRLFPIGRQFNAFINRGLFSTPQLRQQEGVRPRMIDGRPTFFLTWMEDVKRDDVDQRLSNDVLATIHPEYFAEQVVSQSAEVTLEETKNPAEQREEMELVRGVRPDNDVEQRTANAEHPLAGLSAE